MTAGDVKQVVASAETEVLATPKKSTAWMSYIVVAVLLGLMLIVTSIGCSGVEMDVSIGKMDSRVSAFWWFAVESAPQLSVEHNGFRNPQIHLSIDKCV